MTSRILITGATGFIGSHLAEILAREGSEVSCLIRKTSSLRWIEKLSLDFHTGEVTDRDSLAEAVQNYGQEDYTDSTQKSPAYLQAVNTIQYFGTNTFSSNHRSKHHHG